MISGDDRWYQVCDRITTAIVAELTLPVCRAGVVPGLIAWDDCSCGLLATTWALLMGSSVFPQEQVYVEGNCDTPWEVAEVAVQVIRCSPSPDGEANAPTVAALAATARQMDTDATQMRRACMQLLCGLKDSYDIVDFLVARNTPQGPEGGCVGSELRMYVALPRNV